MERNVGERFNDPLNDVNLIVCEGRSDMTDCKNCYYGQKDLPYPCYADKKFQGLCSKEFLSDGKSVFFKKYKRKRHIRVPGLVYMKRLLVMFMFLFRLFAALMGLVLTWPVDILAFPVYYVATGKIYSIKINPLSVSVAFWIIGLGFNWKVNR